MRKTIAKTLAILVLLAGCWVCMPVLADAGQSPAAGLIAAQTDNQQDAEGATRADESPMDEFDPDEATWEAWLGPIVLGLFGLILLFAIRRFTLARRLRQEKQQEEHKDDQPR